MILKAAYTLEEYSFPCFKFNLSLDVLTFLHVNEWKSSGQAWKVIGYLWGFFFNDFYFFHYNCLQCSVSFLQKMKEKCTAK